MSFADGVPICNLVAYAFTTTGTLLIPEQNESKNVPFVVAPTKWTLQVTGVDNTNTPQTPSAWDVIVQPSLDGIGFNDMTTPILEHKNGTNGNGDCSFASPSSFPSLFPLRFLKIHVKTLTLGASATKILVSLLGVL